MKNIKISDYRKDNRTIEEFQKDIKYGNETEQKIIEKYKEKIQKEQGKTLQIVNNGCDNSGELLSEEEVTLDADYKMEDLPLEVKFNNNFCNVFHIKESQLKSYIKQKANVLWVNGYTTKTPEYKVLSLDELKFIQKNNELVEFAGWGGKKARKIYQSDFSWKPFK